MIKKLILAYFLLAQFLVLSAHSALFDDKEARKKILEVESAMNSQNQIVQSDLATLKKAQKDLDQRLLAAEGLVKAGGLMDMQNQIELLRQELAKLKGELELANHNVETTQQRQKDLYGDTDARLRKIEGGAVSAANAGDASLANPTAAPAKNTQEYQLLELAHGFLRDAKYKDAFNAYDKFLKDYPNSGLAAEAIYGLGYAQFSLKNYKSSMITQQKLLDLYPESPQAPDAMLNIANSQIQLDLVPAAKKTLRDLIAKFPNSKATPTAQKRLKALEAI